MGIFALKPAPIQISYLGYPNTTGLKTIDYKIIDKITNPNESTQRYSEKLLYLDNCFLLYESITNKFSKPKINFIGNNDCIILASTCREGKITEQMLNLWKIILKDCPNTKILIKIESKTMIAEKTLYYSTALFGSDNSDRLILQDCETLTDYNKIYNKIDIVLDSFPYSGTTTTCDCLINSVPIITLYNPNLHSHNVSASILINSNLQQLVTYSNEEYIDNVKKLVNDVEQLNYLKSIIHDNFVCLMNPNKFIKNYEELLKSLISF